MKVVELVKATVIVLIAFGVNPVFAGGLSVEQISIGGQVCLCVQGEFEVDNCNSVVFASTDFSFDIVGDWDPNVGRYCLQVAPWFEEVSLADLKSAVSGVYWIEPGLNTQVDLTWCSRVGEDRVYVKAVIGDFITNSSLVEISQSGDKSGSAEGVVLITSPSDVNDFVVIRNPSSSRRDEADCEVNKKSNSGLAYPNPFNGQVNFILEDNVKLGGPLVLEVYDIRGRRVYNSTINSEARSVKWMGQDNHGRVVESGCYLCSVRSMSGRVVVEEKITFLK